MFPFFQYKELKRETGLLPLNVWSLEGDGNHPPILAWLPTEPAGMASVDVQNMLELMKADETDDEDDDIHTS